MKKRSIARFLNRQYKQLETREQKTRARLNRLYMAYNSTVESIIHDLYMSCVIDGKPDYSQLFRRITKSKAAELQRKTAELKQIIPEEAAAVFPFTVTRFDTLNRLDAAKVSFILNQSALAEAEYKLIDAHLSAFCKDTWTALEEYLEVDWMYPEAGVVRFLTEDQEHPIRETLYRNNLHIAEQVTERVRQSITRGEPVQACVKTVTEYAERQERGTTERVLFTEGTRTAVDTVTEELEPYIEAFYTVCVKDEKTCEVCKGVEAEQQIHPVAIEYYKPGTTAPPWHPYCRCGIEVIWNDRSYED